jgi:ATPase subunit of ABC transporter with duplicated ATPase domains
MDQDALLVVEELSAGYGRPVVGPVSFSVHRGDVIGVRGPNGAGKSTLLNAIAGGARIFSGSIHRRPILRVSHQQQAALPLDNVPLSGRELLALTGADARGLPDWIKPLVGKRLDRLSGGQLQFMQIWACLSAPVDIILLDEPTNNVDPHGVQHLQNQIHSMSPSHAMLVISHDYAFLDKICNRTLNLHS